LTGWHFGDLPARLRCGCYQGFHSVADTVLCVAEIQRRMARRNADVSPARNTWSALIAPADTVIE